DKAEDEYLRQRKDDIVDVKERLLGAIKKTQESINITEERVIVVSERIYPSDIMRLLKYGVLGFVSKYGSVYSHSAILARSLNIPYICQAETNYELIREGEILVLDGKSGEVFIDPDPKMIEIFTELVKNQEEQIEASYKTEKIVACTKKGKTIKVMANCNHIYEIDIIAKQDFDGVGLVRSEYLFADHDAYPSEEEQYELYLRFVEKFDPLPVVIRTFDFGADKPNRFLSFDNEDNPALGYRGIRISLREKELFKTQLRALYRASARGNLQIMFPMVTSVEQVTLIKKIIEEVLQELETLGKDYDEDTEIGLMIETPGAALISDLLADEVDFFSIGTNDLIQYTLAVDRTNANIADLYEADHKAIKRLIKMTCKNAKKAKIRVAMCGEMAEDHALLSRLIDYGVQELSVSPNKINRIKRQICEL
ncbi:MAG: phosphoenolpyruvate--protein phosphotransferase, partial [Bacilli bacterium]|nr:phosphoenolpyruvate--protein phosphotransferase [Bacilli bacterium]